MKKFFIGFSLTFFALTILVGLPAGGAMLFDHLGYDKELGLAVGVMLLICIGAGLGYMSDDEESAKYKVQIGDKEFECNTITHRIELDSIIVDMDGVESRVAIGTNIIITDK